MSVAVDGETADRSSGRRDQIIAAALRSFLKFGYDRTGMAEIAEEAALSRAALYHYFAGKEAVVLALVDQLHARTLAAAEAAAAAGGPFEQRLFATLDARLGDLHRVLRGSPHRAELNDATHRVTGDITNAADDRFLALLSALFASASEKGEIDLNPAGLTPETGAELCFLSAKGIMQVFSESAADPAFEPRLRRLTRMTALALARGASSPHASTD